MNRSCRANGSILGLRGEVQKPHRKPEQCECAKKKQTGRQAQEDVAVHSFTLGGRMTGDKNVFQRAAGTSGTTRNRIGP